MMTPSELTAILRHGNHSLAVAMADGTVATFDSRGIADLYRLLDQTPHLLRGTDIADKVVGKGAAALMIAGRVNSVHAIVISTPARRLLETSSVEVTFDCEVPAIRNRRGDGICPVEALCMDCTTADECLPRIKTFINSQNR